MMKDEDEKALEAYEKVVVMVSEIFGCEHPRLGVVFNNLGDLYLRIQQYEQAKDYLNKALKIRLKSKDIDADDLGSTYTSLALLHIILGSFNESLYFCFQALHIRSKIPETDTNNISETYKVLARYYLTKFDYCQALHYCELAQYRCQSQSIKLALVHEMFADIFYQMGQFNEAISHYQASIDMQLQLTVRTNVCLARSYRNIGIVHGSNKELNEALQYFAKGRDLAPENSIIMADLHQATANIYLELKLFDKVVEHSDQAKTLFDKLAPNTRIYVAETLRTIGILNLKKGNLDLARKNLTDALVIFEKELPEFYPTTSGIYLNLGLTLEKLTNVHTHENCTQQAINLLNGINDDQLLSVHHYTPAQLSKDIAIIYNDLKQYESALRMLEFTLQHIADDEHYLGAGAHLLVANIYWKLGHKSQALEHLDQALVMLDNMNKEYYHEMIICIFKSMANVHKTSNEYRQVLECYQKLLSFCKTDELAQIHMDIGFCYSELNEMELSLESYQLARSLCSSTNYELLANIYDGLGKYYAHSGNSIEAINNFETTLNIRLLYMQNDDSRLTSLYADLGQLYLESEKYKEAANFFEQLLDKQMKQNEQENAINTLVLLGITQVRQKNIDKGIYYYKMAFQLSLSMSSPDYKIAAFICSHMGEAYDLDCNPWQCVESYEKAIEMAWRVEPHDDELLSLFHENAQVARQSVIKTESKIIEAEEATTTTTTEHD
ncbi:unnamed protein product [Rotaria sp. Silwood2]|nr:unnamed protein product [Rotaria sp. Silwood2]CAF4604145.1 unnamed protein product [Rotaria sp. Silwood2]